MVYFWVGVGLLVFVLEIFKCFCLWVEVVFCYVSNVVREDEGGCGKDGEVRVKVIFWWRLFNKMGIVFENLE